MSETSIEYWDHLRIIGEHLDQCEILAQMAEEAAELAQACLKLRRAMMNVNPTPVTMEEARRRLTEEIADVKLCEDLLTKGIEPAPEYVILTMGNKAARWVKRLKADGKE